MAHPYSLPVSAARNVAFSAIFWMFPPGIFSFASFGISKPSVGAPTGNTRRQISDLGYTLDQYHAYAILHHVIHDQLAADPLLFVRGVNPSTILRPTVYA
jgi:hypothetical protein